MALLLASAAPLHQAMAAKMRQPVTIQILSISDWRGQLDPLSTDGGNVGGAAVLAAYFNQDRLSNPNTLLLATGGSVGASPPISSFFQDEPTIRAMRLIGFNADTLGNHNFEAGLARLQYQIALAGDTSGLIAGTALRYLSANLRNLEENLAGVDKMTIFNIGGVKVAVIGLTNVDAPTLVTAGSFGSIQVTDPVTAANRTAAVARRAGADVVIAIFHAGVVSPDPTGAAAGPLIDFARGALGFDLILGGDETDVQYTGTINGALVAQNRSKGLSYSRIAVTVDPGEGVTSKTIAFITPYAVAVTPDPAVANLVDSYRAQLGPILSSVIGSATLRIPQSDSCGHADGRSCESLVGNAMTDAMRLRYGADFAITNSGGLRADLTCPEAGGGPGFCPPAPPLNQITRGQVLAVVPFGNAVATLSATGAELKSFLENGVSVAPGSSGRFPQVSGLCFTYDISAPAGSRVTAVIRQLADGSCTGSSVDLSASSTYTLAINDFMASGGDGYPAVSDRAATRDTMEQVLADYVVHGSPISAGIQGRIVCTDSNVADAAACPVVTSP